MQRVAVLSGLDGCDVSGKVMDDLQSIGFTTTLFVVQKNTASNLLVVPTPPAPETVDGNDTGRVGNSTAFASMHITALTEAAAVVLVGTPGFKEVLSAALAPGIAAKCLGLNHQNETALEDVLVHITATRKCGLRPVPLPLPPHPHPRFETTTQTVSSHVDCTYPLFLPPSELWSDHRLQANTKRLCRCSAKERAQPRSQTPCSGTLSEMLVRRTLTCNQWWGSPDNTRQQGYCLPSPPLGYFLQRRLRRGQYCSRHPTANSP